MRTSPINMTPDDVRKFGWFLFFVVALLLLPSIYWNFAYDQGTFAYCGSAILRGERPYLDFWDIKPPNIFYTYAIAFAVFGESVRAIRIADYLNALVTIAMTYILFVRLWKHLKWVRPIAFVAIYFFMVMYRTQGAWNTAQAETFSVPFILGAALLVVPKKTDGLMRAPLMAFLSGILLAIAFYFKFPNGIFLPVIAIYLAVNSQPQVRWKRVGILLSGFVIGTGVETAYLAMTGELAELWRITTTSTADYVSINYSGSFSIIRNLRTSADVLGWLFIVTCIAFWVRAFILLRRDRTSLMRMLRTALLPAMCLAASFIIVQLQNKGYTYHYAIMLPWALLVGLPGAAIDTGALPQTKRHRFPGFRKAGNLFGCIALLQWVIPTHEVADLSPTLLWNGIHGATTSTSNYIAGDSMVNYVCLHTSPSDRIFIFGFEPYVYWKSGRHPANRFLNTIHFKPSYVPRELRSELVESLTSHPPALILVETADRYTSQGDSPDDSRTVIRKSYPEIEQLLAAKYIAKDTISSAIAYMLK